MDDSRVMRLGRRASLVVGSALVVAAFVGLTVVHHLDDVVDAQYADYARYSRWVANPRDDAALEALREQTATIGDDISQRQATVDLYALGLTLLLAGLAGTGVLLATSRFRRDDTGLHAIALERMPLRSELQTAIREQQLVLRFQPTVDLRTEMITGFEALVRWQHPTRGLLAPKAFISVAEQSGLVVELGSWVLHEACHAAAGLQSSLHQPTMSVNVAAQQIVQSDFVDSVLRSLEMSGLEARHLILEITESVLLDDMVGAVQQLAKLRERGVHVAIDDFGTGYSSLAYLSRLPVDVLKVDKSFVDRVCDGREDASVTEAIFAMSRTMNLTTVAEGVELPEQAAWLKGAACTMGQGFLWSGPVDLARAHHLIRAGVRPG